MNEATKFLEIKLFQDVTYESSIQVGYHTTDMEKTNIINSNREYSISDLIKFSKGKIEEKVFLINDQTVLKRYVHIKCVKFQQNQMDKYMLQIIDVSDGIMYDQQKAENSFLALINACVSHELRNPLNSIISQNVEKKFLYQELKEVVDSLQIDIVEKTRIDTLMDQLEKGMKVQDSSA